MAKILFIIILFISCTTSIQKEENNNFIPYYFPHNQEEINTFNSQFSINIKTLNYNDNQNKKIERAALLLKIIFNSEEYKQEVYNFTFKGQKKFFENNNKTNIEIYDQLMLGAEALLPVINRQMDITVKMYYSWRSTVGYTYPNSLIIYTNSKFHNSYTPCQVASNVTHEWTHKMGFGHSQKWTKERDYTVPYGHNTIIEKLCPLAEQNKLTNLKSQ